MDLYDTPFGLSEAARNHIVQVVGNGEDTHSAIDP